MSASSAFKAFHVIYQPYESSLLYHGKYQSERRKSKARRGVEGTIYSRHCKHYPEQGRAECLAQPECRSVEGHNYRTILS